MYKETLIEDLVGKSFATVSDEGGAELIFKASDGTGYRFYHSQDCCESVYIEDICGELTDLENSPILLAEEVSGEIPPAPPEGDVDEWTFYKFSTIKGSVTVRWFGTSNGYYSTSVDLCEL